MLTTFATVGPEWYTRYTRQAPSAASHGLSSPGYSAASGWTIQLAPLSLLRARLMSPSNRPPAPVATQRLAA